MPIAASLRHEARFGAAASYKGNHENSQNVREYFNPANDPIERAKSMRESCRSEWECKGKHYKEMHNSPTGIGYAPEHKEVIRLFATLHSDAQADHVPNQVHCNKHDKDANEHASWVFSWVNEFQQQDGCREQYIIQNPYYVACSNRRFPSAAPKP